MSMLISRPRFKSRVLWLIAPVAIVMNFGLFERVWSLGARQHLLVLSCSCSSFRGAMGVRRSWN